MMKKIKSKLKNKEPKEVKQNHDEVAKALEILFATDYIDKHKLYLNNFIRGIFFSAGGVVGATVVIAILLWVLSFFNNVPLVGPLVENTRETIQQNQSPNGN